MTNHVGATKVRTLFVSDFHLGTAGCKAELLLDFLRSFEASTIYLIGDIVDDQRLRPGRAWPRPHLDVVAELLARVQGGARIIYIPGNHDESLRKFIGLDIGGIKVADSAIHENVDGRRFLVLHGDQVDIVVQRIRWLALVGTWAYRASLAISPRMTLPPRRLGSAYGSLSARARLSIRSVINAISRSEEMLATEVRRHDVQGVVCGHTHHAEDGQLAGVRYLNTGDWVESCTGVVEYQDGRLELVRWAERAVLQTNKVQVLRQGDAGFPSADIQVAA